MTTVTYDLALRLAALRHDLAGRPTARSPRDGGARRDVTAVTEQTALLPVSRRDLAQILSALDQRGDRTNGDPQWRDLVERVEQATQEWGPPGPREVRRGTA